MTKITEFNKNNADIEEFIQRSAGSFNNIEEAKEGADAPVPGAETC